MNKKLLYLFSASVFAFSACTKSKDDSNKDDKKTETVKKIDGTDKIKALAEKNQDSSLYVTLNNLSSESDLEGALADLQSGFEGMVFDAKISAKGIPIDKESVSQFNLSTKKIDLGFSLNGEVDSKSNASVTFKTEETASLKKAYNQIKSMAEFKQVLAFIPELKNISIADLNYQIVMDEETDNYYLKSSLQNKLFPGMKKDWIKIAKTEFTGIAEGLIQPDDSSTDLGFLDEIKSDSPRDSWENYFAISYIGSEKIDGEKTEHYEIAFDPAKAKGMEMDGYRDLTDKEIKIIQDGMTVKADAWISDLFELKKVGFKFTMDGSEEFVEIMNGISEKTESEANFDDSLVGGEISISFNVEADKTVKISYPAKKDFITTDEFAKILKDSTLGSLIETYAGLKTTNTGIENEIASA